MVRAERADEHRPAAAVDEAGQAALLLQGEGECAEVNRGEVKDGSDQHQSTTKESGDVHKETDPNKQPGPINVFPRRRGP